MKIGYIIGTYPLVTTTFIDREMQGLRQRGFDLAILSIRRPPRQVEQIEEYRQTMKNMLYVFPIAWIRFLLAQLYFGITHFAAYWSLLGYLFTRPHSNLRQRIKTLAHFFEGVYAAYLLRDANCDHLHAHFVDRAAVVALCVSRLLHKPYSLTAHANDLYAGPVLLFEKMKHAQFVVTVSNFNKKYILEKCPGLDAEKILVLHPWVDGSEFAPPINRAPNRRFSILSVGRLVEKKGHRFLIEACRQLRTQGLHLDCRIVGGGPLEEELRALINRYGMADLITLEGAQSKAHVLQRLAEADAFVLASTIARDGDRDGMPVALAEAMAMQVPVISTALVGIGELVQPGAGILVPPENPGALAQAIKQIYSMNRAAQVEMGQRARAIVQHNFEVNQGIDQLAEMFRHSDTRKNDSVGTPQTSNALDLKSTFIVWGAPSVGPRSQVLARELGIDALHFIRAGDRRGMWSAPFRYASQAIETIVDLAREQPQVVFIQSPPSLAVLCAYIYSRLTGAKYLIDAHSAALLQRVWMWPHWLHRLLLRHAITTMVTNEHFAEQIEAEGGHAFVLRDIPTQFTGQQTSYPLGGSFKVAIVNTFSPDEPLPAMLAAARELPQIDFYITGKKKPAHAEIISNAPPNAHFTDFLPDEAYYAMLAAVDAVMCLTTRQHTMQRGACEALSLGKPIVTSDTPLLQNYFYRGAVHVGNTSESIRDGILEMQAHLNRYQSEILELQIERQFEWQERKQALAGLIRQAVATSGH
ncbi:MAG: glycosyltransferase [Chloroflexi bacterium]|nr:glycosyltransferase [Chloroflexota bacterium]